MAWLAGLKLKDKNNYLGASRYILSKNINSSSKCIVYLRGVLSPLDNKSEQPKYCLSLSKEYSGTILKP